MITKILFTIAIIATVIFVSRYRSGRRGRPLRIPSAAGPAPSRSPVPMRLAAYAAIGLIIAATALWLLLEWRSAHEILRVRVINSATGSASEYEAYRSDIGQRSFRTVDGRRVNLAEVERLEVSGD
jgi:hypothetical protein